MSNIAIFGAIGAGKTTLAEAIVANGSGCEVLSFASPFKELAVAMLNRPLDKSTDRLFLANIGQGLRSDILKFMGLHYLREFILMSSIELKCEDELARDQFVYRVFKTLDKFSTDNPDWGHADFWLNLTLKKVAALNKAGRTVVIDDLRFKHEFDVLKASGFEFIKVVCDQSAREARIIARDGKYNPDTEFHQSELEWPEFEKCPTVTMYDPTLEPDPLKQLNLRYQLRPESDPSDRS